MLERDSLVETVEDEKARDDGETDTPTPVRGITSGQTGDDAVGEEHSDCRGEPEEATTELLDVEASKSGEDHCVDQPSGGGGRNLSAHSSRSQVLR